MYSDPVTTFLIVVIDDDADARTMMWAYLNTFLPTSVRVKTYGDVEFREGKVNWTGCCVAIIDVMMPVVDGREVLRWLKDEHPDTYRIAWTAASETFKNDLLEEALAHEVVQKPGLGELKAIVTANI